MANCSTTLLEGGIVMDIVDTSVMVANAFVHVSGPSICLSIRFLITTRGDDNLTK